MKLLFTIAVVFSAIFSFAQTKKIDSLKAVVLTATPDVARLDAVLALYGESQSMNIDTLYRYATMATQLAQTHGDKGKIMQAAEAKIIWFERRNLLDSALSLCNAQLAGSQYATAWDIYARLTMRKAVIFVKSNKRKEALALAFGFLSEAEAKGDVVSQVYCKYVISSVYRYMEQTVPALQWALKADSTGSDSLYQDKKNAIGVYYLTGMMYNWKFVADTLPRDLLYDSLRSVHYLNKAITYSRQSQNMAVLARALDLMADQTESPANWDYAGKCLKEADGIYRQLGDTVSILNSITAMSNYYVSIHQPQKGIEACLRGIDMIKRGNAFPVADMYWTLGYCYKAAGDYVKYAETLNTIISVKDTVYKRNSENDLAALNAKYEDVKKQNTIIQQKYDLTRKNYLLYGSLILSALAGLVFYLLFREYRRQQKIRLEQIKAEEKRLAIKAVTEAEENQRRRIAADLHDNLGSQANAILYGTEQLLQGPEGKDGLLSDLHDTAKDMLLSLRETLWAMKTSDVTAVDVWLRVINFSMQMKRYYRSINIVTAGIAPEGFELSAAKALHAILIIQEAVNNAIRHANATEIVVSNTYNEARWHIKVCDNGSGFNLRSVEGREGHYGLSNMRERAQAAGLVIKVETEIQKGTAILLDIPITRAVKQHYPNGVLQTNWPCNTIA